MQGLFAFKPFCLTLSISGPSLHHISLSLFPPPNLVAYQTMFVVLITIALVNYRGAIVYINNITHCMD